MDMMTTQYKIGTIIRVEWNKEDDRVLLIMEISDENFKKQVLYTNKYQSILTIQGTDILAAREE